MRHSVLTTLFLCMISLASTCVEAKLSPGVFVAGFEAQVSKALSVNDLQKANELFVEYFDMESFGKKCLVDHWNDFTTDERRKFLDLLEKNLRKRLREKMLITSNKDRKFSLKMTKQYPDGGFLRVENKLGISKGDFKLVLWLTDRNGKAEIVDYEVEGALLSRNYRGHFNYLYDKYGKEGFLKKLEDKLMQ